MQLPNVVYYAHECLLRSVIWYLKNKENYYSPLVLLSRSLPLSGMVYLKYSIEAMMNGLARNRRNSSHMRRFPERVFGSHFQSVNCQTKWRQEWTLWLSGEEFQLWRIEWVEQSWIEPKESWEIFGRVPVPSRSQSYHQYQLETLRVQQLTVGY